MRITSGTYGGRRLVVPKGRDVRPTSDKVRQAVFNMLLKYELPANARVVDVFCGTGALGLEALSRGAQHCIFIDKDVTCVRENIAAFGIEDGAEVIRKNATKTGPRPAYYNGAQLVFCDPPYNKDLVPAALNDLYAQGWIAQGAVIIAETEKNYTYPETEHFTMLDVRLYGDTQILVLRAA